MSHVALLLSKMGIPIILCDVGSMEYGIFVLILRTYYPSLRFRSELGKLGIPFLWTSLSSMFDFNVYNIGMYAIYFLSVESWESLFLLKVYRNV